MYLHLLFISCGYITDVCWFYVFIILSYYTIIISSLIVSTHLYVVVTWLFMSACWQAVIAMSLLNRSNGNRGQCPYRVWRFAHIISPSPPFSFLWCKDTDMLPPFRIVPNSALLLHHSIHSLQRVELTWYFAVFTFTLCTSSVCTTIVIDYFLP